MSHKLGLEFEMNFIKLNAEAELDPNRPCVTESVVSYKSFLVELNQGSIVTVAKTLNMLSLLKVALASFILVRQCRRKFSNPEADDVAPRSLEKLAQPPNCREKQTDK
jgi:hypothetical protein